MSERRACRTLQADRSLVRANTVLKEPGTVTKRAAMMLGEPVGYARAPCAADPTHDEAVRDVLQRAGLTGHANAPVA